MEKTAAPPEQSEIRSLANAIRALSMDAVEAAKSGHPGMPMGMADVATVLFRHFLKFDAADPTWPDRDRFVLSAGHGSMLLYSLLYLTGYDGISLDDIKHFRKVGSPCAGHPEYGHAAGIETTTGPLGQGISNAVGMALAERLLNARFGDALVDHKTYVIASDGDLMEGISHESISIAGHYRVSKLIVLYDDNHISIDGPTSLADSTDTRKRFEAAGWRTDACDGQNAPDVYRALAAAQSSDKPVLIACRTTIGFGAPTKAGTAKAHGEALGPEEVAGARKKLGWPYEPFVVPNELLAEWREIGDRGKKSRNAWVERRRTAPTDRLAAFDAAHGEIPERLSQAIGELKRKLANEKPTVATRKASEMALDVINAVLPNTIGGSADLTGSNNTRSKDLKNITPDDFSGRYFHFGIREHGMVAAMSGMSLHGGIIPYGGTFLVFSDYCRPAIRLAALMGIRSILVMTHDSIGLGEDGPTHQPIEQLAALRAMPNLLVFRPADAIETAECWEIALKEKHRPSLLALTRQNLPTVRDAHSDENLCAKGAYVLHENTGAKVSLLATGSEIEIALKARDILSTENIAARIVSMPCWDLFEEQPETYRQQVLGEAELRIGIEAASPFGWDRYLGAKGKFVGMHSYGASGPYKDVYKKFQITPEAVAEKTRAALKRV